MVFIACVSDSGKTAVYFSGPVTLEKAVLPLLVAFGLFLYFWASHLQDIVKATKGNSYVFKFYTIIGIFRYSCREIV